MKWATAAALAIVTALVSPASAQDIGMPLTQIPGDPVRGRSVVRDLEKATCLICHAMPIPEEPNHGDIGPPLAGVGSRLTAVQLRQRIIDPMAVNPATVMPSYYRREGLNRVLARFAGQTIYTAQDVEDVVAYLATLREP
jgi:sulfur-oxidizing protein SoxX